MAKPPASLLQGTLDLLILKALSTGELHGLGVSRRIEQLTGGTFVVQPGSLFPALHRLEEAGWLSASWDASENNRRAKFYTLTRTGRKQLGQETAAVEPDLAGHRQGAGSVGPQRCSGCRSLWRNLPRRATRRARPRRRDAGDARRADRREARGRRLRRRGRGARR